MTRNNIKSSKQKSIELHSQLKVQFLKLYSFPIVETEFLTMIDMLEFSGVEKTVLESFLKDGKFDFNQYAKFIKLSEETIISIHTQISRMSSFY